MSITNSQSLPKLMSIASVMPCSHLILYCFLLLLPSIIPSIRGFSNESDFRMRWPKYWSFSFSITPSNVHPGLISLTLGWLDLRAVQGPRKSLLQHFSHGGVCVSVGLFSLSPYSSPAERVTGRKARGLQMEKIACKCQTFLSLLRAGRNKLVIFFFSLLYTNLKEGFS